MAVGAGVVVCAGLLAAISLQFAKAPAKEAELPTGSAETESFVNPSGVEETKDEASKETAIGETGTDETDAGELVIQPETGTAEESQTPVDIRPAQTDQEKQSIQPEPMRPAAPSEEALKDPTTKPDGTKVEGSPAAVEHEKVETPAQTEPAPGEPQAGDTSGGKIYIPGFGWVENHGGGGSGITAHDMYENGNKIGVMD